MNRTAVFETSSYWEKTTNYCQNECFATIFFAVSIIGVTVLVWISVVFFQMNEHRLPFNFSIAGLPFDEISFNWLVNYIYQFVVQGYASIVFTAYCTLILLLINHCCWKIDFAISMVERLHRGTEEMIPDIEMMSDDLKTIIEKSYDVLDWYNDVQNVVQFHFLLEFSVLSFILAMALFSFVVNPSSSVTIYTAVLVSLPQLFFYCLFGQRVITRIDNYTYALYEVQWYELNVQQRKDFQKILMMAQQLQGFHGIFQSVNMETFMEV